MSKNIALYLMLLCLFISIAMKNFDVIKTIANVSCFVFVLLYVKEELKTYTRNSLAILSICFLFLVGICSFMILQGQAVIGWKTMAVILLIIISLSICAFILRKISNRLKLS
ncbi:YoqO family protein [Bacillus rugosus]|uniref:YoqO family protein n=1 Tax=Bacillus rugosus TaxID=2715209 RepID=UPI002DBBE1A5|nr:YoqO family protein [Bacillus rugosus]MEC1546824.1 YoqO family protein [Bacillus rugosus]